MLEWLFDLLSMTFVARAFFVGALVSLCAALLGVSLVLKRYSMIGDGLSHVGFGALSIAVAANLAPLPVALVVVVGSAFLLLRVGERSRVSGDAQVAVVSTSALAIGVLISSATGGMNMDVGNLMFGSIFAMSDGDVWLSVGTSVCVLALYALFYNRIFSVTFDERFARATGTNAGLYNLIIALLTAVTVVVGMRMMGTLLISSLIVFPALTSMRLASRFRSVVICSAAVSLICFFAGILASCAFDLPAGASVVAANLIAFCLFYAAGRVVSRAS